MKLIAPAYYQDFRCIAGACRHSCCIGWEIDIDEDTRDYYATIPGPLGDKLAACIADEEESSHFILQEHERCPFLQEDGLCQLICTLGEDSLCQICADHPRFYNEWADRTEVGLGLCCEAAAALILRQEEPFTLTVLEDDGEAEACPDEEISLLTQRERLLKIASDRTASIPARMAQIAAAVGAAPDDTPLPVWAERLAALERLDPLWDGHLQAIASTPDADVLLQDPAYALPLEQLLCAFLYRHIPGALQDGQTAARALFACVSVRIIAAVAQCMDTLPLEALAEAARMFSAEVEYSDENLQAVEEFLMLNS